MKSKLLTLSAIAIALLFMLPSYDGMTNAQTANKTQSLEEFLNLPENKLCKETSPGIKYCQLPIATIKHETNNTLYIGTTDLDFIGPVLDFIYDKGFKLESSFTSNNIEGPYSWMYFRK